MRQTNILSQSRFSPCTKSLRRLWRIPAGGWPFPTLSLRSLYRRLVRTPPRLNGAIVRFFPFSIGLPLDVRRSARENFPTKQLHMGRRSRGCNHSLTFRLPYSLGPPTVLTIKELYPSGHRTLYTGLYMFRCRSQAPASLHVRTGQLTRQDL